MDRTEIVFQLIAKLKHGELSDSQIQDLGNILLTPPNNETQEDSYDEYLMSMYEVGDESVLND
jgi:hypothetical protein